MCAFYFASLRTVVFVFTISLHGRLWLLWERELECKRRRIFGILNSISVLGNIAPLCYSITNGLVHAVTTPELTYVIWNEVIPLFVYIFTLSLYITVNTTTIQYNASATCFDLQQSSSG